MSKHTVLIEANDCCAFSNQEGHGNAIQYFISQKDLINVFQFGNKNGEELELATFNYRDSKWYAGRLVGEAKFDYNEQEYHLIVNPRFGNVHLFRMLEEVFNIRLTKSKKAFEKHKDVQFLIKKLISFLWLNLLSKANKHGIPRQNITKTHKGSAIRGRINIRKSIISIHTEEKIVSEYREKSPSETIVTILRRAYRKLNLEYHLSSVKPTQSSKNAIEQLNSAKICSKPITERDYNSIQYKEIYKLFKPVVDLSWDILRSNNFGNSAKHDSKGISFFIDMAEIWELYLKSILKKRLSIYGWRLRNDVIRTYQGKNFQRRLIPDIVFERDNELMVWDAKYKRMHFVYFDYDRSDFFQIHTYINYYDKNFEVIAGGLLYPLSKEYSDEKATQNRSDSLFGEGKDNTQFIVDGIDLRDIDINAIKREESAFLDRIVNRIRNKRLVTYEQ